MIDRPMHMPIRRAASPALAAIALLVTLTLGAGTAKAVPVEEFEVGASTTQAGGHPDVLTRMLVGNPVTTEFLPCDCNHIRDLKVEMPPGVVGSPKDLPECTQAQIGLGTCPTDSQVGLEAIKFSEGVFADVTVVTPLYNMVPPPSQLALLASPQLGSGGLTVNTLISTRTESDYGLEFNTIGIPNLIAIRQVSIITWGVPADPSHDALRFPYHMFLHAFSCAGGDGNPLPVLLAGEFPELHCARQFFGIPGNVMASTPSNSAPVPFISNPTACASGLVATVDSVGYDLTREHLDDSYPPAAALPDRSPRGAPEAGQSSRC